MYKMLNEIGNKTTSYIAPNTKYGRNGRHTVHYISSVNMLLLPFEAKNKNDTWATRNGSQFRL